MAEPGAQSTGNGGGRPRGAVAAIWRHRSRMLAILDVLTVGGVF